MGEDGCLVRLNSHVVPSLLYTLMPEFDVTRGARKLAHLGRGVLVSLTLLVSGEGVVPSGGA